MGKAYLVINILPVYLGLNGVFAMCCAGYKQKQVNKQVSGSVLLAVLLFLTMGSLLLADGHFMQLQRLQREIERTHLAELQIVANSVLLQAALNLENPDALWPPDWHLPEGIRLTAELYPEACQEAQCYRVELQLFGRGNTSVQRSQSYWGELACGNTE